MTTTYTMDQIEGLVSLATAADGLEYMKELGRNVRTDISLAECRFGKEADAKIAGLAERMTAVLKELITLREDLAELRLEVVA